MSRKISKEEFERALGAALQNFPEISIKEEQKTCIESLVVDKKDVLGVLPTGFGKSLIYQLLPRIFKHLWSDSSGERKVFKVIVVNPLELIRSQQVSRLNERGLKAASLDDINEENVENLEVIFGSAEQWLSDKWKGELARGRLKDAEVLVVDEAHTVETWGTGKKGKAAFRKAFGQLKDLRSFLNGKPLLALTATADSKMRKDLCKSLSLRNPKEVVISPNKDNIRFTVCKADEHLRCFDWLVSLVKEEKEKCPFTIIFCHTVSDIVLILETLLMKIGNAAYVGGTAPAPERCLIGVYYSATPDSMKKRVCDSFGGHQGVARVVIASTSLSMGVDFPSVKYVIHFGPGRSISEHLQQAGRAGRDSSPANNIIVYRGKHMNQCEQPIRDVIKKDGCIRQLLLKNFINDSSIESVTPPHKCCSRCHQECSCSDAGACAEAIPDFDKIQEHSTTFSSSGVGRMVTEEDKECLKEALIEVQLSLGVESKLSFFDNTGVITHGFSSSVINVLVENCDRIFSVPDLMNCGLISSLKLAVIILQVFNEVFEDIEIDESLYELIQVASAFDEVMATVQSYEPEAQSDTDENDFF